MSKGSKGGSVKSGVGSGTKSGGAARPGTGFPGGNWPSTTGKPSGGGRGQVPSGNKGK